jgi:hypothetical protein
MILDLESEEVMNGFDRPRSRCQNAHLAPVYRVLGPVSNLTSQLFHCVNARRLGVVDEHRQVEISAGKHFGDPVHVLPNGCEATLVGWVISLDHDSSAIREKEEVMSCQSVAETHRDVAPAINLCSVLRITTWSGARRLLSTCFG